MYAPQKVSCRNRYFLVRPETPQCSQSWTKPPPGHVAESSVARVGSRTGYPARLIPSLTQALAVMPLVSTAVETRRLDIHAAGSCRCSFESRFFSASDQRHQHSIHLEQG